MGDNMKRFKTKRKIKYLKIIKYLIIISIIIAILKYLANNQIFQINSLQTIKNSNNYTEKTSINKIGLKLLKIDINKPITILKNSLPYYSANKNYHLVKNEIQENISENTAPLVYIYNTHQTESYIPNNETEPIPTVMTATYYLKDLLNEKGIKVIVEEQNIQEILKQNNWNYADSYKASRINLEKIKNENPSIKIFIDLHRDAVNKTSSTVTINEKNYAKLLFVIGKEHANYLSNLEYTESINNLIKNKYPTLTKGIMQKEGIGVNGIYNQDIASNAILIEVGGNENTLDEVTNTIEILSDIIAEKINEK